MLTVDCTDVLSIKNELVVYVSDEVAAIPTLKTASIYSINIR